MKLLFLATIILSASFIISDCTQEGQECQNDTVCCTISFCHGQCQDWGLLFLMQKANDSLQTENTFSGAWMILMFIAGIGLGVAVMLSKRRSNPYAKMENHTYEMQS